MTNKCHAHLNIFLCVSHDSPRCKICPRFVSGWLVTFAEAGFKLVSEISWHQKQKTITQLLLVNLGVFISGPKTDLIGPKTGPNRAQNTAKHVR